MARTPAVTRESVPERERDAFDAFVAGRERSRPPDRVRSC